MPSQRAARRSGGLFGHQPGDPDRRSGLLNWPRKKGCLFNLEVHTLEAERLAAPKAVQNNERFVQLLRTNPIVGVLSEQFEFGTWREAEPGAEGQSSIR
jgi:hypothetical protein